MQQPQQTLLKDGKAYELVILEHTVTGGKVTNSTVRPLTKMYATPDQALDAFVAKLEAAKSSEYNDQFDKGDKVEVYSAVDQHMMGTGVITDILDVYIIKSSIVGKDGKENIIFTDERNDEPPPEEMVRTNRAMIVRNDVLITMDDTDKEYYGSQVAFKKVGV